MVGGDGGPLVLLFVVQTLAGLAAVELFRDPTGYADWTTTAFFLGYGLTALAFLPLNCGSLLGLHRMNLRLARREPAGFAGQGPPLWSARGKRRLLACQAATVPFGFGMMWAGVGVVWDAGLTDILTTALTFAAVATPWLGLWVLFWPTPYLILDRPDLRGVRPLAASLRGLRNDPGGHLAAGAASGLALVAAVTPWGFGLPVFGPLAGLLSAHGFDRLGRAGAFGAGEEGAGGKNRDPAP